MPCGRALVTWVATLVFCAALPLEGRAQAPSDDWDGGATLVVWNHPIVTFHANYEARTPQARADSARARIEALPIDAAAMPVTAEFIQIGSATGMLVRVGGQLTFGLLPADVEPGVDLRQAAEDAGRRLEAALQARAAQQRWDVIGRGVLLVLVATVLTIAVIVVLRRLRRLTDVRVERLIGRVQSHVSWMHPELGARIVSLIRTVIDLMAWTVRLAVILVWTVFSLLQFPLSAPLGSRLADRFGALLSQYGVGIVQALPGLFVAAVIFAVAHAIAQLIGIGFGLISSHVVKVRWVHADTARATQRLVLVFVWASALLAAYPYIPGSDTDAFKGLTLLFGLIISLGSAGLAGQAMSGLTAVYSRILRKGEFVRIGEIEGQVLSVGLLATKLCTAGREEITIPNSVLMSSSTTNYSRLVKGGAAVATTVGIGYDAPWRQVEGMLQLAASRTPGLAPEPPPRVMQRRLRTFDVEYALLAFVKPGQSRALVLSELNANVQDAFNEFGVQIMTPAFESQPEQDVVVPPSRWHDAPAAQSAELRRERHRVEGTPGARSIR